LEKAKKNLILAGRGRHEVKAGVIIKIQEEFLHQHHLVEENEEGGEQEGEEAEGEERGKAVAGGEAPAVVLTKIRTRPKSAITTGRHEQQGKWPRRDFDAKFLHSSTASTAQQASILVALLACV